MFVKPAQSVGNCPSLWQGWGDDCYRLVTTLLPWQEARSACRDLGGELAAPRSLPENMFLANMALEVDVYYHFWISCSDLETQEEWKCDGHENGFSFSNWYTGFQYFPENRCVLVAASDTVWFNAPCTNAQHSVCVRQPRRLKPNGWFSTGTTNPDHPTSCLVDHVIKEFVITNIPSCAFACIKEPRCRSINIKITEEGGREVCQLNDSTRFDAPNDFQKPGVGCVHYSLDQ